MELKDRASSADLHWNCSFPLIAEEMDIDQSNVGREEGSAFHAIAKYYPDLANAPDVADVADRFGVDRDDLTRMARFGYSIYRDSLATTFAGGETEEAYYLTEGRDDYVIEIRATLDLLKIAEASKMAHILDYKTGRIEGAHEHQLRMQGWLVLNSHPKLDYVRSSVCYVRLGYMDTKQYSRRELKQWFDDYLWRVRNGLGTYSPGDHCQYCPHRLDCDGRREFNAKALMAFHDTKPFVSLTKANMEIEGPRHADILRRVKYMMSVCEEYKKALKEVVGLLGNVPAGDDKVLKIVTSQIRAVNATAAWPVITDGEELPEMMRGLVKLSISKCEDMALVALPDDAKPAERIAAKKARIKALEEAGAINIVERASLKEMKGPTDDRTAG